MTKTQFLCKFFFKIQAGGFLKAVFERFETWLKFIKFGHGLILCRLNDVICSLKVHPFYIDAEKPAKTAKNVSIQIYKTQITHTK